MSRPVAPLPKGLNEVLSAAEAESAGISGRRLKHPDIVRITRGIYRRIDPERTLDQGQPESGLEISNFLKRKSEWQENQLELASAVSRHMPPKHFFCIRTAALLWKLPTFQDLNENLDIACLSPNRPLRRQGFNARRIDPRLATVVKLARSGILVTDPTSTWAMHADVLPLGDLVALGDAVIRHRRIPGTTRLERPPLADLADLEKMVAVGRRHGIDRLRQALPLLSTKSASVPESHLRLELEPWGLPKVELDYDVYDGSGRLLGCSEFAFPKYKLALEYEGIDHRTKTAQWNRDIEKYRDYTQAGWEAIRVTSELLYTKQWKLRAQIIEALRRRGWTG
ncbi:hypothetical protein G7068_13495 [Leucobacter viscericola]|uniref:DUF559 domain-containing protein n=1 Tax=Leucobacter viscericola TaxID=2714935 RepID=A0A6G7XHZ0_9MICO|nr:hypothetical protein [Leucobacter viscericola]QIK64096.1 hypothetical protein G7068_13495 [Leucobacter viscericola]